MTESQITVLIPAFNEADNISQTISALKKVKYPVRIVVIDDCSSDNTAAIAEENGAEVIRLPKNMGKGGAVNRGLTEVNSGTVVFLDADLKETASEVEKLLQPVLENKTDMTIAQFGPPRRKSGFGLASGLARTGLKMLTGLNFKSPLSGQRALRYDVLQAINKTVSAGFGMEVGLTVDVYRAGFRIKEIPVKMTHAETGRDFQGFLHRGKQCLDIISVLLKKWVGKWS